jgi:integrase
MIDGVTFNIAKSVRHRTRKDGTLVVHQRWRVDYVDPTVGRRRIKTFRTRELAVAYQNRVIADLAAGRHFDRRKVPTVGDAIDAHLKECTRNVKASTLETYRIVLERVRGPILVGSDRERAEYAQTGVVPEGTHLVPGLGNVKLNQLTTAQIRSWYNIVADNCGGYTAGRAVSHLKAVLALAEEDLGIRMCAMPRNLGRAKARTKKKILQPDEVARLLEAAKSDRILGPYVAFAFLAGTRPSEQLGLLWSDIDFEAGVIHICRMQERDGSLCELTKTAAGTRSVPVGPMLRSLLLEWKLSCPRLNGELHRVFPALGRRQAWPKPRIGGGGPLTYHKFLRRFWMPFFKKHSIAYVTPHAARHGYVSTMQLQGVEVGLVAKLAGHANPNVTLSVYTQAMRGGESAVAALEQAYSR